MGWGGVGWGWGGGGGGLGMYFYVFAIASSKRTPVFLAVANADFYPGIVLPSLIMIGGLGSLRPKGISKMTDCSVWSETSAVKLL